MSSLKVTLDLFLPDIFMGSGLIKSKLYDLYKLCLAPRYENASGQAIRSMF
jgi:hypothetical protein